ncbi:MAG: hypothetical protein ACUVX8_14275 [Candidatus Zipacnadales bacterium]
MKLLSISVLGIIMLPVGAQDWEGVAPDSRLPSVPRLALPSAEPIEKESVSATYTYRGASYEGRDMSAHQFGIVVGLTDHLEFGWDLHRIDIEGRHRGNSFDVEAMGWQVRYGMDLLKAPGALFFQYRRADGEVVTNGARRIPPDAESFTLGAIRSSPWGKKARLHTCASVSRGEVGRQNAITWMGGTGIDYPLTHDLTAQGSLALFKETGDITTFEVGLSGGIHYQTQSGFTADLLGTFLPTGTPLAGSPLADGSIFVLDPVFRAEPIVRDFQDASLGFYEIRLGYATTF